MKQFNSQIQKVNPTEQQTIIEYNQRVGAD